MYEELLRGLFATGNLMTAELQANYLRALQPGVKALRQGYTRYPVSIDYADRSIQAAYLLAYFPHYTEPVYEGFRRAAAIAIPTHLSLFATGPCPEIVGLLRYIGDHRPQHADPIHITTYDVAHDDWAWSRNIVLRHVVPAFRGPRFCNFVGHGLDLAVPFQLDSVGREFCVFQNCLNEIPQDAWGTFTRSVMGLYQRLQPGSYLCMIHSGERASPRIRVEELIRNIQRQITDQYSGDVIVKDITEGNEEGLIRHTSSFGYPPLEITQNLLTTAPGPPGRMNGDLDLLPKRKLPFRYSLIKRA